MSNSPDTAEWVAIAVLGRARGNKGEVTAHSLSSRPERFTALESVHLFGSGELGTGQAYDVERVWDHQGTLIFKFWGVDSINDAEKLRGAEVRVPASERIDLDTGEFFQSDLAGCELRDRESGRLIGIVTGVEEYGGPTLLEIDGGRMLIPFVKAICTEIQPENRVIRVTLPDGLEALANE